MTYFQVKHKKDLLIFENHVCMFLIINMEVIGEMCMTSKMHGFYHVIEDLKLYKCQLYTNSTYPFETALQDFQTMLRSGNQPLHQIKYVLILNESFSIIQVHK